MKRIIHNYIEIILSFLIILIIGLQGCKKEIEIEDTILPSDIALKYLDEALDILEHNSINRKVIDWNSFRKEVHDSAGSAQVPKETYTAIRFALKSLNDNHSFFLTPEQISYLETTWGDTVLPVIDSKLIDNIGYIKIPAFTGDSLRSLRFANRLQNEIKRSDNDSIKGWIVDLRGNGGGNMWPMLAGIGPILGDGLVGYAIDPDDSKIPWYYIEGAALFGGETVVEVTNPYILFSINPKVAVLTDKYTFSSGEAIVVAFRGRENTKSFGTPTGGLSTGNDGFEMSDGALIILTVSTFADRTTELYGKSINPDQITLDTQTLSTCIEWIKN